METDRKKRTFPLLAALTITRRTEMSGDQDSRDFAEVVDSHYDRIFRGALSVTRDKHLAEEIVQETFLSAFRKFDSFSGRSSVFTWLYRIMLNNYRKHCRGKSLLRRLGFVRAEASASHLKGISSAAFSPASELADLEERDLLVKAVDTLPPRLRIVVAMRYFDGLRLGEIAGILHCRSGTVKSRLFSARKRLCQILQRKLRHE